MKPLSMQRRLLQALQSILRSDLEEAFFQLAPVVDATAKRHYPAIRQQERFVRWLDEQQLDMFRIATHGHQLISGGFGKPGSQAIERIAQAFYKARCAAIHDPDELSDIVVFVIESSFGYREGRFIINRGMLIAFALLVLSDPVNRASLSLEQLKGKWFQYGAVRIDLARCVDNRAWLVAMFQIPDPARP